jgi:hypothetical protein
VPVLPERVFDETGYGDVANIISAIDYAVAHGVRVINLSIGFRDAEVEPMLATLRRYPNVTFVVGAGNEGLISTTASDAIYASGPTAGSGPRVTPSTAMTAASTK